MFFLKRLLISLLFSCACIAAQGQLNANFTPSFTIGCAPLVVNFTNNSTGAISYYWDLGNGTTTTLTTPSTSYVNPGTFTVTLIAYGPNNTQSTATQTITVLGPPVASFTGSPLAGCPGTTVQFTDQSNLIVPGPGTYAWDFGDGSPISTAQNPTHTYTYPGFFNVSLFVTNSQGCTKSLIQSSYIHIYTPPSINVSANQTYFCNAPATVQFNNNTTGTQPITYQWAFGTGGTSTATNPSYTYTNTGSYTVTIIAQDGNGCKDTLPMSNYINVTSINAEFTLPSTACVYTPVTFTNTSSTHQSRTWDFDDGNTSTGLSPTHTFNAPGVYDVQLIIVNGPCSDTVIHQITILPQPPSDFTISPPIACPPPSTLQFTSSAPPGSTYAWDFGGGTSTAANPSYTYNSVGVKTITLVVTSSAGCKDTIVHTDTIYNGFLDINIEPDSGCAPLPVDFTSQLYTTIPYNSPIPYPSPVVSYSWTFGDGGTSNQAQPTYTYVNPGIYNAVLTVTTANGCTFTDTQEVRAGVVPHAEFTMAPLHICYNDSVVFDNLSTNATGYLWIFGDNWMNSNDFEPTYYYYLPGTFTPMLIAYNNGCPDTFISPVTVQVDSPKAIIALEYTCNPRTQVQFYDSSLGTNSVLWMFGDGQTSTLADPLHNYPAYGTYTVKLATHNIASGCRDTAQFVINLVDPQTDFFANDTAICDDEWASFTPVVTGTTVLAYHWLFPNINHTNEFQANATDTFYTPGIYPVTLIIFDENGCPDTATKLNYMLVALPNGSINTTPNSGCAPLTVQFQDNTTDVPGTFLTNWEFTYGDGNTGNYTVPTSSHTYVNGGTFYGQVIVTDNIGCKDTVAYTINSYKPTASFVASSTFPCRYQNVTFTNYSTGTNLTYEWSFGDGGTSTVASPTYAYTANGTYTVELIITDGNGCKDTFTATNYLTVTSPNAAFTMDSVAVCPPLIPNIQNQSTGAFFYSWDLGNGNTSFAYNPSVTYVTSGAYPVTLIATNQYGCADTAVITATIYGYAGAFNYTPLSGCSPLTVLFQANLSNVPSITWDFNDGTTATVSATDTITHTYDHAGYYIPNLILSDNTGCQTSNTGIDTIKVDSLIMGFDPVAACINSTVQLIDTSHGLFSSTTITSWDWLFHDGATSNVFNPTHFYGPSGDYPVTLIVTSSTGCTDTLTSFVTIHELPIITACPDTVVCVNDSATLFATGGVSYLWGPDDGSLSCTNCLTPYAAPQVVTTYTVEGTDQYGCKNTDTVQVSLKTKTESLAEDAELCHLDTIELSVTQAQYWSWEPTTGLSNPQIGNPLAYPDTTTIYTVITRDGTCIPDTNYVTVTVNPLPVVNAGPDITITGGGTAQLLATGTNIYAVAWKPASTLSCDSCDNPKASPKVTTNYIVYAFSDKGCMDTSDIRVFVVCDESQIFIPTVFTPNNDGQNDLFYPRGKGVNLVKTFKIYNRWGELLFERKNFQLNDEANAWDGRYKGNDPKPDVYVYFMEAVCDTGDPMFIKGDVTIIR